MGLLGEKLNLGFFRRERSKTTNQETTKADPTGKAENVLSPEILKIKGSIEKLKSELASTTEVIASEGKDIGTKDTAVIKYQATHGGNMPHFPDLENEVNGYKLELERTQLELLSALCTERDTGKTGLENEIDTVRKDLRMRRAEINYEKEKIEVEIQNIKSRRMAGQKREVDPETGVSVYVNLADDIQEERNNEIKEKLESRIKTIDEVLAASLPK